MGSTLAAKLGEAGRDVTILARGQRLRDIRDHGIEVEDWDTGHGSQVRVPVIEALNADDTYDLVAVLVSKDKAPSTLPALAASRKTPNVLFAGNNLTGTDGLTDALARDRIFLGFPVFIASFRGRVVRYAFGEKGARFVLGELDGTESNRMRRTAEELTTAGFRPEIRKDVDAWLKYHAATVAPMPLALYRAGGDLRVLAADRESLALMFQAIREGYRTLERLGYPLTPRGLWMYRWLPSSVLVLLMRHMMRSGRLDRGVAHAEAARGEIQFLGAQLQALARRAQVETPAIDQLSSLPRR
jgi:2-dehydropantoate 2-reductase